MKYELLLQTGEADSEYDAARVDAALEQRGAAKRPDGVRVWTLPEGEVEARPLKEGAVIRATELRIPLSDKLDLVRALVVKGHELAREAGVKLYDPQLSRTVGEKDEGLVAEQFLNTARYAGEMMGIPEAVAASFQPPEEGLKPGTRLLIGVVVLVALVLFVLDRLLVR